MLHEISGSGYAGAAILAAGIAFAVPRRFWLFSIAGPVAAIFAANLVLHYFFATRQLIFVLPALALLFVSGTTDPRRGKAAWLLAAFLAASIYEDIQWFRKPRENWQAAADAVQREVASGACVQFAGDSAPVYEFFYPSLAQHHCEGAPAHVVTGTSTYVSTPPPAGRVLDFNGPRVIVQQQ